MRFIFLSICVFFFTSSSFAANDLCSQKFAGFFEREIAYTPELPPKELLRAEGNLILQDIISATEIAPWSPIAAKGFANVGKCFALTLSNPETVGALVQSDFKLSVLALKNAHAAAWSLNQASANTLNSPACFALIDRLTNSASKGLSKLNAYYDDGYFKLEIPTLLEPIAKKILITNDERFLITKYLLGFSPSSKHGEEIYQVCAYPVFN